MDTEALRELLERQEGKKFYAYDDAVGFPFEQGDKLEGNLTIGIGHNLTSRGISEYIIESLFAEDVTVATASCLKIFPGFRQWSSNRQIAMISMMFNLGEARFTKFKKMIAHANKRQWEGVVKEMLDSKAAKQLPGRYKELAELILKGG